MEAMQPPPPIIEMATNENNPARADEGLPAAQTDCAGVRSDPRPDSEPGSAAMEKVPFDLMFLIARNGLGHRDALNLGMVSRTIRRTIGHPEFLVSAEETRKFYLEVERFNQHRDLLTCFSCMKLQPRNLFADRQATGRRGKWSKSPSVAETRFCWECGAARRLYLETQPIRKDGFLWYLCHQCGQYKHRSQRCKKVDYEVNDDFTTPTCRATHTKTVCTPVWPPSVPSPLERMLPAALMDKVVGHLGYRDRLSLAATNRHFRLVVRPLDAPLQDKYAAVRAAAESLWASTNNNTRRGTATLPRDSFPCAACFRVRAPARFGWSARVGVQQKSLGDWWGKRCTACCVAMARDTDGARASLAEFLSRELCWACQVVKHRGEVCGSCREEGPKWDNWRKVRGKREERLTREVEAAEQGDDLVGWLDMEAMMGGVGGEGEGSNGNEEEEEEQEAQDVSGGAPASAAQDGEEVEATADAPPQARAEGFRARLTGGAMSPAEPSLYHRLQSFLRARQQQQQQLRLRADEAAAEGHNQGQESRRSGVWEVVRMAIVGAKRTAVGRA